MSLEYQFSWQQFIFILFAFIAVYVLLQMLHDLLIRAKFLGRIRFELSKSVKLALLIYEPLAIFLVLIMFAFVNLPINGILILLLLLFSAFHLKNYITGQIIKFNTAFGPGKQIKVQQHQGIITSAGKFGLKIKTNQGVQYLQYANLIEQGYLLFSGENISGYYTLAISIKPDKEKNMSLDHQTVLDILITSPYLDLSQQPEIFPSSTEDEIHVRVLVKEENHLYNLITMLEGKGYNCKIIQL